MLEILRRIVQEVSAARELNEALQIIVSRVRQAMAVDVCSIFLVDKNVSQYVLMATAGLPAEFVGGVRLPMGEGLISVVAQREEPVNLDDANTHPAYRPYPGSKGTHFHAFLGVPIIHHRAVMGVLVVRQKEIRFFDANEEAFLVTTAAQLAGAIAHAETIGEVDKLLSHHHLGEQALKGLPGAPGVAVGQVMVAYPAADLDAIPDRSIDDIESEIAVFKAAVVRTKEDIQRFAAQCHSQFHNGEQALFDAYLLMLEGQSIVGRTIERIGAGSWAAGALRDTIKERARVFDEMDDPYLRDRANDVRDLGQRILICLQKGRVKPPPYPKSTILVGDEISATMLADVPRENLVGVVSVRGSVSSHVSILAKALGIPAVVGIDDLPVSRLDHTEMIIDGYRGRVYISPSESVKREYWRLQREEAELTAGLAELNDLPAQSLDGYRIPLYANSGLVADLTTSLSGGAEGIGLYRTEFPFMVRDRFPGEEEQRQIYADILQTFSPHPVVLRTLDIGGDKSLPYFPITEDNPFLGWRGIRVTLDHPDIFLVQLRAMLKASIGLSNLRIVLPMVSHIAELDEALVLFNQAYAEVVAESGLINRPLIGVMIEVPSAIFLIDAMAKRVDFFSVGTNDLTQYLLAVDRNNSHVANLYDALHPAVIHALTEIVARAHRYGKPVSVCGEMAGDPVAAIVMLGLGIDHLSMSVASIARVKSVIRHFSQHAAANIVQHLLTLESAHAVRAHLNSLLEGADLGGLVRVGGDIGINSNEIDQDLTRSVVDLYSQR